MILGRTGALRGGVLRGFTRLLLVGACIPLGGCGSTPTGGAQAQGPGAASYVLDSERFRAVRRVALMPAFISSRGPAGLRRGTDDPCFEGWGASNYPTASIYKALSKTETPFEFLPRETVCRALLARGFQGFPKGASLFQQAKLVGTLSLSIPQALAVGRDLGADGVMLVGIGNLATGGLGWVEHLGARLLDVRSARVVWGGHVAEKAPMIPKSAGPYAGFLIRLLKGDRKDAGSSPSRADLIAVLPPENETVDLRAPEFYSSVLATALLSKGYLAVTTPAQDDILRGLGVTDGGQLPSVQPQALASALGVDGLLYSVAGEMGSVAGTKLQAKVAARLVDARGTVIWETEGSQVLVVPAFGAAALPMNVMMERVLRIPLLPALGVEEAVRDVASKVPPWPAPPASPR